MRYLVICRPAAGGDQDEFKRLVPFETEALREQKAKGVLSGAWNPGGPGAVLMFEASEEPEVARVLSTFPLVQAGLITTELIPLHPIGL